MEPFYLSTAKKMLDTETLEDSLVEMLAAADRRIKLGAEYAGLRSTQVIAGIIATWESMQ